MSPDSEQMTEFEQRSRVLLEESVSRIDSRIRSRLNQARQAAVAETATRRPALWRFFTLMPTAGAVAAALLVTMVLWHRQPQADLALAEGTHTAVEDLDLLADGEGLDLVEDGDGSGNFTSGRGSIRPSGRRDGHLMLDRRARWLLAVTVLVAGVGSAAADDNRKAADPVLDDELLEFLGSVDPASESVQPDDGSWIEYLSQTDIGKVAKNPTVAEAKPVAPAPKPSAPGVKENE